MSYLEPIDIATPEFGDLFDELPLWSAPFGLWILEHAPLRPAQTILDIGCGTGFLAIELAERCGPTATVIAVDPWRAAMDRLRRKIAQHGLTNIHLLEQDAAEIELPERSVDLIISNLGVNNFADPVAVLRVCARAARPGAGLLLTTNLVGHMAELYEAYRTALLSVGQAERIAALEAHIGHRATPESLRGMLESAGFTVSEIAVSSFPLRFADGSAMLRHFFIRLGFMEAWADVAAPGRAPEALAALERELNALAAARGELSLTIPMAGVLAHRAAGT